MNSEGLFRPAYFACVPATAWLLEAGRLRIDPKQLLGCDETAALVGIAATSSIQVSPFESGDAQVSK